MSFFRHITLTYIRKNSIVHRMDAISKLLAVIVISVAMYFFQQPWQLAIMLMLLFFTGIFLVRVNLLRVLATFSIFVLFGTFVFVFQMLGHPQGNPYFTFAFIRITDSGLFNASIFLFRMTTIGCSAVIYLWTTKPKDFVIGLIRLGVPYRLGFSILVALRFLPLINDEIQKIQDAHLIRGMPKGTGLKSMFERWNRYLFPILANGLRKAETAGMAMESRSFGLYKERSYITPFKWTTSGLIMLFFIIGLTAILGVVGGFQFLQPRYNQ